MALVDDALEGVAAGEVEGDELGEAEDAEDAVAVEGEREDALVDVVEGVVGVGEGGRAEGDAGAGLAVLQDHGALGVAGDGGRGDELLPKRVAAVAVEGGAEGEDVAGLDGDVAGDEVEAEELVVGVDRHDLGGAEAQQGGAADRGVGEGGLEADLRVEQDREAGRGQRVGWVGVEDEGAEGGVCFGGVRVVVLVADDGDDAVLGPVVVAADAGQDGGRGAALGVEADDGVAVLAAREHGAGPAVVAGRDPARVGGELARGLAAGAGAPHLAVGLGEADGGEVDDLGGDEVAAVVDEQRDGVGGELAAGGELQQAHGAALAADLAEGDGIGQLVVAAGREASEASEASEAGEDETARHPGEDRPRRAGRQAPGCAPRIA